MKSQRLAVQSYDSVLAGVLADGTVQDEERRFLRDWRARRGISEAQHAEALHRLGWSEDEFERGEKMSDSPGITAKVGRALYSLATFSWLTTSGENNSNSGGGGGGEKKVSSASASPGGPAGGTTENEEAATEGRKIRDPRKERSLPGNTGTSESTEEKRERALTGSEAAEESLEPGRLESSTVHDNSMRKRVSSASSDSGDARDATL